MMDVDVRKGYAVKVCKVNGGARYTWHETWDKAMLEVEGLNKDEINLVIIEREDRMYPTEDESIPKFMSGG